MKKLMLITVFALSALVSMAQPVSQLAKKEYKKATAATQQDKYPDNNGSVVRLLSHSANANTLSAYQSVITDTEQLEYVMTTSFTVTDVKTVKVKEEIVEGGGDPEYVVEVTLASGKKGKQALYGNDEKPVVKSLNKFTFYMSSQEAANNFAQLIKAKKK